MSLKYWVQDAVYHEEGKQKDPTYQGFIQH